MDSVNVRLAKCFRAVLPEYSGDIEQVRPADSGEWDSLAAVSLLLAIREEFDIHVPPQDLDRLVSFKSAEQYISQRVSNSGGKADT